MDHKDLSSLYKDAGREALVEMLNGNSQRVHASPHNDSPLTPEPPKVVVGKSPSSFPQIVSSRDLLAQEIARPPVLVDGLLHQGSKMVIGAGSKSFKTWCMMDLGLSVASGTPWWGRNTRQGRVLYINLELQDAFFRERLVTIQRARELADTVWDHFDALNLRGYCADFMKLREQITAAAGGRYTLIIIDPVYKVLGNRDENSAGNMGELLNEFEKVAVQTGAAVLYGHHFSKGNQSRKESIDRMSGSGVFARDADTLLVMSKHELEDVFVVEPTLRNFKPIPGFCVKWDHPLMRLERSADPAQLKQNKPPQKLYFVEQLLTALGAESLSRIALRTAVQTATTMSNRTFDKLFKDAREAGQIGEVPNTNLWSAVKLPEAQ